MCSLYTIDPDGEQIGHLPIEVHCSFTEETATTTVLHDHGDEDISITHCEESGCFVQEYNYEAPTEQIISLMELSEECSQKIQYR